MALSIDELPSDVDSPKALMLAKQAKAEAARAKTEAAEAKAASLTAEMDRLATRAERLDHIVAVLRRAHFSRRSERIGDELTALALEDVETQHGVEDAAAEKGCNIIEDEGAKSAVPISATCRCICRARRSS